MFAELAPPLPVDERRDARLEHIARLEHQIAQLQARLRLETAALYEDDRGTRGEKYVTDQLALVTARSPRQASNRLMDGLVFASFPAVASRVADGTWLMDHADAVLGELSGSGLDHAAQVQVLELVLSRKVPRTPWELRGAVRTAALVLFPDHAADRARKAKSDRDVQSYPFAGGASLLASGPAASVAAMMASLDALCWPPAPEDTRTAAQRRFDTLYDLVCGRTQPGQWQVQVLVDLATLLGTADLPAELAGFSALTASEARQLLADGGELRRVVVDEHGRLVAVDPEVHRPDLPIAPPAAATFSNDEEPEPMDLEPDPEAPTAADLAWFEEHSWHDRALVPVTATPTVLPAPITTEPSALEARWSAVALTRALHRICTLPVRTVDLHSDRYQTPKRLKRHLVLRDRQCVFPGCPRRADRCDSDHLLPWPRGSTTEINLASECEHHHQAKHAWFTLHRLPDGTFRWTTPAGRHYDRPPVPVLPAHEYLRPDLTWR